jgi:hypothetical protein
MAAKLPPIIAAFDIPLTDKQLQTLGRVTALWAQVDFLTDHVLMRSLGIDAAQFDFLLSDKMVGTKVAMIQRLVERIGDKTARDAVAEFARRADAAKTHRNHAAHGVWGWRVSERGEFAAARHARSPGTPLRAERLKRLEREIAEVSVLALKALAFFTGVSVPPGGRFNFGAADQPPTRMREGAVILASGRPKPPKRPKGKAAPPRS